MLALALVAASFGTDGRPVLSGPEMTYDTADGRFKFHYTFVGTDAILDLSDTDPTNGRPDGLDWCEEGLARMIDAFVVTDGWPASPPDEGIGGDDRQDVYFMDLGGSNGYTYTQQLPSGKWGTFIEIDPRRTSLGKQPFESVCGHELHHTFQFTITQAPEIWIYEATSTWAQYLVFGGSDPDDRVLPAAVDALWEIRLDNSANPIDHALAGDEFEYAGFSWIKFLVDHSGGDRRVILDLWYAMAAAGTWDGGSDAIFPEEFGLASANDAAATFAVWNEFACDRDDGYHYDPSNLPCGISDHVPALTAMTGTTAAIGRRGSRYVEIPHDCATKDLAFDVTATDDTIFSLVETTTGAQPVVDTVFVAGGTGGTLRAADWNDRSRVALVGTDVGPGGGTFDWTATASGAYTAPAETPPPSALTLDPASDAEIPVGTTLSLKVIADYSTCAPGGVDDTAAAVWTSSNDGVATVAGGIVTAVAPGGTHISASDGRATSKSIFVKVVEGVAIPDPPTSKGCGCTVRGGGGSAPSPIVLLLFTALLARAAGRRTRSSS